MCCAAFKLCGVFGVRWTSQACRSATSPSLLMKKHMRASSRIAVTSSLPDLADFYAPHQDYRAKPSALFGLLEFDLYNLTNNSHQSQALFRL